MSENPPSTAETDVDALISASAEYEAGFVTDIDTETFPPGVNEDVVRAISARKEEPEWMTEWRLEALAKWQAMTPPRWPLSSGSRRPSTTRFESRYAASPPGPRQGELGEVHGQASAGAEASGPNQGASSKTPGP